MVRWRLRPILALALLALPAAAPAQERMVSEEVAIKPIRLEIEAVQARFVAAVNGDDRATVANSYTADAVLMPPNMPIVEGREAIGEFFGQGMGGATITLKIRDVHPQGRDAALEAGSYEITGADGSHLDHGKYLVAWSRTDDGWKMKYDIWNSSMAPAGMDDEAMQGAAPGEAAHDAAHEAAHVIQQKAGAAKDEPDYLDEDSDDDGVLDVD